MKKMLLTAIMTAAILAIAGCEKFTTSYNRIDDSEFRMLDFIYEPADASPGDTITLTAVFAGKTTVDLRSDIEWSISFNVMRDLLFGSTTVVDSMLLTGSFDTVFSPKTRAVAFRIPIPKDIMRTSKQIPDKWTDMLPDQMVDVIPADFASMTKNQIIDTLESFLENPAGVISDGGSNPLVQNADYLPQLLQFFTVPIRVTAKMNEPGRLPHTIRSNQIIRYNRSIREDAKINAIPVNRNPVVDSIVVYKVKGKNVSTFDSKSSLKSTTPHIWLYNPQSPVEDPVIEVEDGYTYFLEAFSSSRLDSSITMGGKDTLETHYAYWQFQLDPKEAGGVHFSRYMDIGGGMGNSLSILTPPSNTDIKKFTLWVTVIDDFLNEMNRPEASTLAEVSGRFVYK